MRRTCRTAHRTFRCVGPLALLMLLGCQSADPLRGAGDVPLVDPSTIAEAARADDGADADAEPQRVELGRDATQSLHVWTIRDAAPRRLHRRHDLLLIVHRGHGRLLLEQRIHVLAPGDVFAVPRGTGYAVESTSDQRLVCLLVFTPPYAGQDTLPWPVGATSYPREAEIP